MRSKRPLAYQAGDQGAQGIGNELMDGQAAAGQAGGVRRRQRLGGLLSYYSRAA